MFRFFLPSAIVLIWMTVTPGLAETWDCGGSEARSVAFTISTDTSACGGATVASGNFIIETDLCGSEGFGQADESIVVDTIWSPGSIKKFAPASVQSNRPAAASAISQSAIHSASSSFSR